MNHIKDHAALEFVSEWCYVKEQLIHSNNWDKQQRECNLRFENIMYRARIRE